jgi:hypothetical protein
MCEKNGNKIKKRKNRNREKETLKDSKRIKLGTKKGLKRD